MKLTRFKSNHNSFILGMENQDYEIIKMSKLKVSFDKNLVNKVNEISGENWLKKNRSFYLKIEITV